ANHLKAEADRAESLTVRECVELFIESRQADHDRGDLAKRSFSELRGIARRVAASFGDRPINDLNADWLRDYLNSLPLSPRSRFSVRLKLSGFLGFCTSKRWMSSNPAAEVKVRVKRSEVEVPS